MPSEDCCSVRCLLFAPGLLPAVFHGDFVEILPCGHRLCEVCTCRMETPNIMCPMCEGCESEDTDISCPEDLTIESKIPLQLLAKTFFRGRLPASSVPTLGDKIMSLSVSSKECSRSTCSVDSSMLVDDFSASKMKQAENEQILPTTHRENTAIHAMDAENATSGDTEDHLYFQIDEALIIANNTLHHLNSAFQTLKVLDTRNNLLESRISSSIHETFGKLVLALKKRKSELFTDLRAVSEVYEADLQDAIKNMEKQIKCLETRVEFAKGLKQSPLVTVYCDLNQLVTDLKISFENEGTLEALKDSPDIRFSLDCDMMLKTFENLGTIYSNVTTKCLSIPNGNAAFKDGLVVKLEPSNSGVKLEDCTDGLIFEKPESDFECMNTDEHKMDTTSQLASGKFLQTFQELPSFSSPDVIIEEIIEGDKSYLLEPQNDSNLDNAKEKPLNMEFRDCKPKKFKKNPKLMGTCAPFCQNKRPLELVYLSHIVNPCNFYVHCYAQKTHLIMLERMLTRLSRTRSHCCPTDVLELGETIAFQSIRCKKWCRGNIIELIPLESKCILKPCGPTRYKIEDLTSLTLCLLDYGGSETFIASRFAGGHFTNSDPMMGRKTKVDDLHQILIKLSSAEENTRLMPPFALHCSLDIVPHSPDGVWKKEIRDHIFKLVGNKCVSMKVSREEHNKLIVDLKKPFDAKINSGMPLSLRDALVFSDFARFPANVSTVPTVTHYTDSILPENIVEVLICHVNDPSDFYIHWVGDTNYGTMEDKIQEVYNTKEAEDWQILSPVVGQPCIAKYTEDDHWYRAEIMVLTKSQVAVIKFVDFGNTLTAKVADLRSLKEEFMTLPRKAICCRLAYIQPFNAKLRWSLRACHTFQDLTSYRRLRCTSIGILLENKLSIELFDDNTSKETSINTILVQENLASFIVCTSDSVDHLPLKEVWDPVLDMSADSVEKCIDNFSLFERKELDVFISHVVSPSKIYVQWLTTENILKRLESSMFDRYGNSKPEAVQWQVDVPVAVQLHSDKQWKRGKVTRIISDSLVEVFCNDFGIQEVTNVANLRTLDENLRVYGTMCLECSLMDIQPAGGTLNWTATACDFLSQYLCGAKARIIIEDNASQWPLPVRILSKNEADQLVDVSEFLVKRGLALRERVKMHISHLEANDKSTKLSVESCLQEQNPAEECASDSKSECAETVTSEQSDIIEPVMESIVEEPYLPPLLPDEKTFLAKVTHVAADGTIHVIQDCFENELNVLMLDIQNSFKCLGLMAPYSWKKGEGCLINGSDTMSYRGKVLEILGGDMITVQYEDFGYTEKLPKCHLYPSVYNSHIPRFCIPCQLNDIFPVGDHWQPDTIQLLKELLLERVVIIHVVEPPKHSHGVASVHICCGGASVSAILEQYAHGIRIDCEKNSQIDTDCIAISNEKIWPLGFQELLQNDLEAPFLPQYSSVSLPRTGELFKVEITHLQTPNVVFICFGNESGKSQLADSCDGDCDPVRAILKEINAEGNELPHLTDFRTAMPCLGMYSDGLLHRAKLQSIKSYGPITCVVEFVDYGSTTVLDTCSLFQLPASLIQYPARAVKVRLAGFRPPTEDFESQRLVYCPEWSLKSLYNMMDLLQKKTFFATRVAGSDNTVFLYDDNRQLVHKQLIDMGLADLDEM